MTPGPSNQHTASDSAPGRRRVFFAAAVSVFSVWLLLSGVSAISLGFGSVIGGVAGARELFESAQNPLAGLMVGILATAFVQSSSTVSSLIVALVAGGLDVSVAVPILLGANIGTSVTSTFVSFGHSENDTAFRRAFSAATVHDFFNLLAVLIIFPIEWLFQPMQRISHLLAEQIAPPDAFDWQPGHWLEPITLLPANLLLKLTSGLGQPTSSLLLVVLGGILIFLAVRLLGRSLQFLLLGKARDILYLAIGRGPFAALGTGVVATGLVHSSSTTTSLMVPLAGAGVLSLREVYPFVMGANIGTCFTALIPAFGVSGPEATLALQVALVHLSFNCFAVLLIGGMPFLRKLPLLCAEWVGAVGGRKRFMAVVYLLAIFYALPALCLLIVRLF